MEAKEEDDTISFRDGMNEKSHIGLRSQGKELARNDNRARGRGTLHVEELAHLEDDCGSRCEIRHQSLVIVGALTSATHRSRSNFIIQLNTLPVSVTLRTRHILGESTTAAGSCPL
jgi:hypothetical protein